MDSLYRVPQLFLFCVHCGVTARTFVDTRGFVCCHCHFVLKNSMSQDLPNVAVKKLKETVSFASLKEPGVMKKMFDAEMQSLESI